MSHQLTTCTFCGTGCGIYLETENNVITGAYPSISHPVNKGKLCIRGWNVHEITNSKDRLLRPLLRNKNGQLQVCSWEDAIDFIAQKIVELKNKYGPDSLAFFNSPRCSNEESYLLQKLARTVIGTNNVDHGTGVYSNNSINVLLEMIGYPASTSSISVIDKSGVIIVDSIDLSMQLPTVGSRVLQSKLKGNKLIVIDTRRNRIAENADIFIQPNPGTESWIYSAMAKVIIDRGLINRRFIKEYCSDYEEFIGSILQFDLQHASEASGVPANLIEEAAQLYASADCASLLFSTGIETRRTSSIQSMINLVLLTGHLGSGRGGIFALTEHNNLQGVCDMGMLPDKLPGYINLNEDSRIKSLEGFWQCKLSRKPGIGARLALKNAADGNIKGIWLSRYDPVSTAYFCDAAKTLEKLDLVIVQHLFLTSTAQFAHVVLPLVAFGEERVTFTNTERRVQLAEKVVMPPDGPLPCWLQIKEISNRLGANWNYKDSADIMDEIGQVVPFYEGINYRSLANDYGKQWPCTKEKPLGTSDIFEDKIRPKSLRFAKMPFIVLDAKPSEEYPFSLVFGMSLYYWHRNVLIQHSEILKREYRTLLLDYPNGFVEINPEDAANLKIRDGDCIKISSSVGSITSWARVTKEIKKGTVFVPYFIQEADRSLIGETVQAMGYRERPVFVKIEKQVL